MLVHFLVTQVFTFFLIVCRIGSGVMILPGYGETYVPVQMRLVFVLAIALLLTPILSKIMPALPASPLALLVLIACEVLTGLFIGSICNILISATHVGGMLISTQVGLSSVVIFDVSQQSQGSIIGNFLGLIVIIAVFTTDLHYLMLRGVVESYAVFIPGHFPPLGEFVESSTRILSETFVAALQIATPLIVAITLLFLGAGVLSRLAPTMQVFFVVMPAQLLLGLFIFTTIFSGIMLWYIEFYREKLTMFLGYLK